MSRKYTGPEKCAGCGKPASEVPRETKNDICYGCKQLIVKGREMEKDFGKKGYVSASPQWYALDIYPFLDNDKEEDKFKGLSRVVDSSFRELLRALHRRGLPSDGGYYPLSSMSATTASDHYVIRKEYAEAISSLADAITAYEKAMARLMEEGEKKAADILEKAKKKSAEIIENERQKLFTEGVNAGKRLLVQLNSGEITLADFDKELKR